MSYPDPSIFATMFGKGTYTSPFFTSTNQFLPKTLKEVILWSDYIVAQSPLIAEVIRKHSSFPITDFTYDTDDVQLRKEYENLHEKMKLRHNICTIGFDYNTRGNVFISLYLPFNRMAYCKNCNSSYHATKSPNVKFKLKVGFHGDCDKCGHTGLFTIKDEFIRDPSRINIVTWDPFYISVNHNPISNESDYYYQIPPSVKRAVKMGDPLFISSLPMGMIEAIDRNVEFKFDPKHIYHFKNNSIGRMNDGMAMPPIMSLFHLVFHQAMLRKANEAIAAEHMTPMRVVFPQGGNSNAADPLLSMSARNFVRNVDDQVRRFKQDPNHLMISPMPIGYQSIGGDGKALLVGQEMEFTEETILMALGVSRELLSGTTNWTSSTIGLRLMANSMENYLRQIKEVVNWVSYSAADFLGLEKIKIDLVPFQLADDDFVRQGFSQLSQAAWMSPSTLSEVFGFNFDKELEQRVKDEVAMAKYDIKKNEAVMKAKMEAGNEANTKEEDHVTGYNEMKNRAYDAFMSVVGMAPDQQRLTLTQLENEDKSLYEMVAEMLERFYNPTRQLTQPEVEDQQTGKTQPSMRPVMEVGQPNEKPDKPAPKKDAKDKGDKK